MFSYVSISVKIAIVGDKYPQIDALLSALTSFYMSRTQGRERQESAVTQSILA